MATVDYYFSLLSPYAYLGHAAVTAMARDTGVTLAYRPVRIFGLFAANGGLPLGQRAPARQRYRLVELQRWREQRGLPLNLQPRYFPVDPSLADRAAIALAQAGADASRYVDAGFRAVWAQDRDIADRAVIAELLRDAGHDAPAVLAAADGEAAATRYQTNTADAIAADLPGLPGYVHQGETFWGQDRIEQLRDAIVSGRAPYLSH
ncbi:2-hydroxychromene-2-carboxylate isomerase [Luteimonas sp. SX5]|uniref:2-hydroxychromene-2-carboxylate isomerase n=1 Tax=Luteimonas galliterrae TaxID=2940486 RepID=A0ABT0ML72_9GAMM|nr:2-hydroxychromene-2-carboxylate isomerase [Luteimonas galliterrae]MCL1635338.1 2-hydroxychromene-2-carboxylate isomerase [Luteimonas galliterrae]